MGRLHARLYRISGGRFMPRWFAGAPVLYLRDRVWRAFVGMYPQAEHYTRFTNRALPLIALQPEGT
jgi:hypothetical protein